MRNISRIELYSRIREYLISDEKKYKWIKIIVGDSFFTNFMELLNLNIILLNDIENVFLVDNKNFQKEFNNEVFLSIYERNASNLSSKISTKNVNKIYEFKTIINKNLERGRDAAYTFNSFLTLLYNINNDEIKKNKFNMVKFYENRKFKLNALEGFNPKGITNRVFLSHAFDDQLYTVCLFLYMLEQSVFLYVDWLMCDKLSSGIEIKNNLEKELSLAKQLLFLRTINSELLIKGSGNIRGWCSWELGSFYSIDFHNKDSKYYIELYRRGSKITENLQLDGIKPLRDIKKGILI